MSINSPGWKVRTERKKYTPGEKFAEGEGRNENEEIGLSDSNPLERPRFVSSFPPPKIGSFSICLSGSWVSDREREIKENE